jgi:methyl-accepting chemotaxis protein
LNYRENKVAIRALFGRSLMAKLAASFLLVALIPLAAVGLLSFSSAKRGIHEANINQLLVCRDKGRDGLLDYLQLLRGDAGYLARNPVVQAAFHNLTVHLDYSLYLDYAIIHPHAPVDTKADEFKKTLSDMDPFFLRFLEQYEIERSYEDVLLIVGEDLGLVMYTAKKLPDLGTSLKVGPLKDTMLAKIWERAKATRKAVLSDFFDYQPAGKPCAFVALPTLREDGTPYGVLALRFGPERINQFIGKLAQIGDTGDAFIVGEDMMLRSASRTRGSEILKMKWDTQAVRNALKGISDHGELIVERGLPILTAWGPVGLRQGESLEADFDWAVIAKIDSSEAFEQVAGLTFRLILLAVLIGATVTLLAYLLARRIARPISLMAETAQQVSDGNLTVDVPKLQTNDELGTLSRSFGFMVSKLREQIRDVLEGVGVLTGAVEQISVTVSKVAVGAAKTSSAVTETSATVEQVKQAALLSGEKARRVAQSAHAAAQTSERGKQATDDTIQRIKVINEQMQSIRGAVIMLSEQSRRIEEIILAVQDLADQSDLLAVNASIEAARAGEHGRGFGVVAQEIKSLANQSKSATDQARAILDDTRRRISMTATATEQAGKAVEAGAAQSLITGAAISSLSESVSASSQAASVIDASTAQQFAGIDQISAAMHNIDQAMRESLEGTNELEAASIQLKGLGDSLKQIVLRYKV